MNQYSTIFNDNSFNFDNLVTFEHACEPSLIWDMLCICIYEFSIELCFKLVIISCELTSFYENTFKCCQSTLLSLTYLCILVYVLNSYDWLSLLCLIFVLMILLNDPMWNAYYICYDNFACKLILLFYGSA